MGDTSLCFLVSYLLPRGVSEAVVSGGLMVFLETSGVFFLCECVREAVARNLREGSYLGNNLNLPHCLHCITAQQSEDCHNSLRIVLVHVQIQAMSTLLNFSVVQPIINNQFNELMTWIIIIIIIT